MGKIKNLIFYSLITKWANIETCFYHVFIHVVWSLSVYNINSMCCLKYMFQFVVLFWNTVHIPLICCQFFTNKIVVFFIAICKHFHMCLGKKTEEAGRAEFNVATPTYATVAYSVFVIIHKQNSFKISSRGVQGWTSTEFCLKYFKHRSEGSYEFFYLFLCKPVGNLSKI